MIDKKTLGAWVGQHPVTTIALGLSGWAFFVVVASIRVPNGIPVPFDFQLTGTFGDSFGIVGAVMASTAAYFAFRAYKEQADENDMLRDERSKSDRVRSEPSYLNLIERRYDALNQVTYRTTDTPRGQDAVSYYARTIRNTTTPDIGALRRFGDYNQNISNLPHLFRFTYHIIRYADENFDFGSAMNRPVTRDDLSYRFVRLLRSQMSNDELFITGLNALTEEGEGAKPYVEKYAMLHTLPESDKQLLRAAGDWDERAFGLPSDDEADEAAATVSALGTHPCFASTISLRSS